MITEGYNAVDVTNNELASNHIRYLNGGRLPAARKETLIRFRLAEVPGAIYNLLESFNSLFISLVHYRNYGADFGRILIGFMIESNEKEAVVELIKGGGHCEIVDESENPVFQQFLK
jgi:threonine dehydratase